MFICAICKSSVGPRISAHKRVAVRRDRSYVNEKGKTSYGWEIVKEVKLCKEDAVIFDEIVATMPNEIINQRMTEYFNPAVERYLAQRDKIHARNYRIEQNPPTI